MSNGNVSFRTIKREIGLTLRDIENATGISKSTLSRIENDYQVKKHDKKTAMSYLREQRIKLKPFKDFIDIINKIPLSHTDISTLLNRSHSYVTLICKGHIRPTAEILNEAKKILDAYGIGELPFKELERQPKVIDSSDQTAGEPKGFDLALGIASEIWECQNAFDEWDEAHKIASRKADIIRAKQESAFSFVMQHKERVKQALNGGTQAFYTNLEEAIGTSRFNHILREATGYILLSEKMGEITGVSVNG